MAKKVLQYWLQVSKELYEKVSAEKESIEILSKFRSNLIETDIDFESLVRLLASARSLKDVDNISVQIQVK